MSGHRQSEAETARAPAGTLEQRQRQTGVAYRALQQARHERRLAEQDYLNAKAAYDRVKREFDSANQAYATAQAREKAAEQDYERGLRAVDAVYGDGPKPVAPSR